MSLERWQRFRGIAMVCLFGIAAAASRMGSAGSAGVDIFVPAVARAVGQANANFYSTLWITNVNSGAANIDVRFHEAGISNTNPLRFFDTLQSGETKKYENVVETKFGRSNASGSLRIVASLPVLASTRTYDVAPGGSLRDSKGLFFAGIPVEVAIGRGQSTLVQGVSQGGIEDFRYNFGALETSGQEATVLATLRDATGTSLGAKAYVLPPYGRIQFPVTDLRASVATTNATVEIAVTAGLGRVLAYGTQIANGSNDSSGFEMSFSGYGAGSAATDHCSGESPGTMVTIYGQTYVIIEVEAVLRGTGRSFAVRYPVPYPSYSAKTKVILNRTCGPFTLNCFMGYQWGSICGRTAALGATSRFSRSEYYIAGTGQSPRVQNAVYLRADVEVLLDPEFEALPLSATPSSYTEQVVQDVASFGYSFIRANYPETPVDLASAELQMASFFDHISVRER